MSVVIGSHWNWKCNACIVLLKEWGTFMREQIMGDKKWNNNKCNARLATIVASHLGGRYWWDFSCI
jgi:hypothetical protein